MELICPRCGASLKTARSRRSRSLRCPTCGFKVSPEEVEDRSTALVPAQSAGAMIEAGHAVPMRSSPPPIPRDPVSKGGASRGLPELKWLIPLAVLLTAAMFWGGLAAVRKARQARRVSQAVELAEAWLAAGRPGDAGAVKEALGDAASVASPSRAEQVQELLQRVLRRERDRHIEALLDRAVRELALGRRDKAEELLKQYFQEPSASRRMEADRLLRQIQDNGAGRASPPQAAAPQQPAPSVPIKQEDPSTAGPAAPGASVPARLKPGDDVRNTGSMAVWNGRVAEVTDGGYRVRIDHVNPLLQTRFRPGEIYLFFDGEVARQYGPSLLEGAKPPQGPLTPESGREGDLPNRPDAAPPAVDRPVTGR